MRPASDPVFMRYPRVQPVVAWLCCSGHEEIAHIEGDAEEAKVTFGSLEHRREKT